jgi:hypothetical protein
MKNISESRKSDPTSFVSECILIAQGLSADKKKPCLAKASSLEGVE